MPQMYVNPDALRDVAGSLAKFSGCVTENMDRLQAQASQLGNSWRDEGFSRFMVEFQRVNAVLRHFVEECDKTVPSLLRDASAAEDYLRKGL